MNYNISVRIWILREYPNLPPLCYVAPTKDMEISVSPFVDHSGQIQGRIQDLSEGGGQDFLGTKKFIVRNKKSRRRGIFFDLKDSKRVRINDERLKN